MCTPTACFADEADAFGLVAAPPSSVGIFFVLPFLCLVFLALVFCKGKQKQTLTQSC